MSKIKNNDIVIKSQFFDKAHPDRGWYASNTISNHSNMKVNAIVKKGSFKSAIDYCSRKTEIEVRQRMPLHSYAQYMNQDYKVTSGGHFTRGGSFTNDEMKTEMKSNPDEWNIPDKSIIWSEVISFTNDFTNEHQIFKKEDAMKILNSTIENFFIDNKVDPDSMVWLGQWHVDTEHHLHMHLRIHQKYPGTFNPKTGKEEWRERGKFTENSFVSWKKDIARVATENSVRREVNYKNVSSLRNQLNFQTTSGFDDMKDRVEVISLSINIKRMIGPKGRFQYKNVKKNPLLKRRVDDLVGLVINASEDSKNGWLEINKNIDKQFDKAHFLPQLEKLRQSSKQNWAKAIEKMRSNKKGEIWDFLANQILKKVKANNWNKNIEKIDKKINMSARQEYKKRNKAVQKISSRRYISKLFDENDNLSKEISRDVEELLNKYIREIQQEQEEGVING